MLNFLKLVSYIISIGEDIVILRKKKHRGIEGGKDNEACSLLLSGSEKKMYVHIYKIYIYGCGGWHKPVIKQMQ